MPAVREGESQKSYVNRCIPVRQREHPGEDTKQSAAICYSMYREHRKDKLRKHRGKKK